MFPPEDESLFRIRIIRLPKSPSVLIKRRLQKKLRKTPKNLLR